MPLRTFMARISAVLATAWLAVLLLLLIPLVRGKPPFTIGTPAAAAAFVALAAGQWVNVQVWRERRWALVVLGVVAVGGVAVVLGPMVVGSSRVSVSSPRLLSGNGFLLLCSGWWVGTLVAHVVSARSASSAS